MNTNILAHVALLLLPAPVLAVGILFVLRRLTWKAGLLCTFVAAIVVTWLYLHTSDFAMACIGSGCGGNWLWRAYLTLYGTTVVAGFLIACILIPVGLHFRPKAPGDAPPA